MQAALSEPVSLSQQDRDISATVRRERGRLLAYIRRSIADAAEAEDILQESFYELVVAHRMMQPVEQAGAWLARVARNRIIDRFRRRALPSPTRVSALPGQRARSIRFRSASRTCCLQPTMDPTLR